MLRDQNVTVKHFISRCYFKYIIWENSFPTEEEKME